MGRKESPRIGQIPQDPGTGYTGRMRGSLASLWFLVRMPTFLSVSSHVRNSSILLDVKSRYSSFFGCQGVYLFVEA